MTWGFPKIRGTVLGVPIILPILRNYHIGIMESKMETTISGLGCVQAQMQKGLRFLWLAARAALCGCKHESCGLPSSSHPPQLQVVGNG